MTSNTSLTASILKGLELPIHIKVDAIAAVAFDLTCVIHLYNILHSGYLGIAGCQSTEGDSSPHPTAAVRCC